MIRIYGSWLSPNSRLRIGKSVWSFHREITVWSWLAVSVMKRRWIGPRRGCCHLPITQVSPIFAKAQNQTGLAVKRYHFYHSVWLCTAAMLQFWLYPGVIGRTGQFSISVTTTTGSFRTFAMARGMELPSWVAKCPSLRNNLASVSNVWSPVINPDWFATVLHIGFKDDKERPRGSTIHVLLLCACVTVSRGYKYCIISLPPKM